MRGLIACVLLALCAWPASAAAQSCLSPNVPDQQYVACVGSEECAQGEVCDQGSCVSAAQASEQASEQAAQAGAREAMLEGKQGGLPRSPAQSKQARAREAEASLTADEACDEDRRCRIERIKKLNATRRRYDGLKQDRRIMKLQESFKEEELAAVNRLAAPINVDFLVQYIAPLGMTAGYTFNGIFRLSGQISNMDTYAFYSGTADGKPGAIDGGIDMWVFGLEGTYLFSDSAFSPYATGGFYMASGGLDGYFYDADSDTGGPTQSELALHMVGAALGVDLQFALGLRVKLGATLRYPIYAGATSGGANDELVREGLDQWFSDDGLIGFEGAFGWAF